MKPRVYIETTIPSYLTAWPSRDMLLATRQQLTREWWARRDGFELFVSRLVVRECQAGDPVAAAERASALTGITLLDQSAEIEALADALMRFVRLPEKAKVDAGHIATATFHGMEYLLTWNCRHIANAVLRPRIEAVCEAAGYKPPLVCTPEELPPPEDIP